MEIEKLTIGEAREIASLFQTTPRQDHPWVIGVKYFIRTVTHHYTGILRAVYQQELVLEKAAWIADDGRLTQALLTGEFDEVEVYPPDKPVIIGRPILDACEINSIPTSQK